MALYELRKYDEGARVWVGKYESLRNLPHWHNDCELIYVEKGTGSVHVGNSAFALEAGASVYVDSGEIHSIEADEGSLIIIFLFDYGVIKNALAKDKLESPRLSRSYDVRGAYERTERELSSGLAYNGAMAESIVVSLMIDIFRGEKTTAKRTEANPYNARYKALLVEIDAKYGYYTFAEAAAFMNISEHYFSGLFHRLSGMIFSKYLNAVKVRKAVELLSSDSDADSITEISIKCGFNTIRHFNRVFKEVTGFSPSELPVGYRMSMQSVRDMKEALDPTLVGSKLILPNS